MGTSTDLTWGSVVCDARIKDGTLVCSRTDPHTTGHVFIASNAAHLTTDQDETGEDW